MGYPAFNVHVSWPYMLCAAPITYETFQSPVSKCLAGVFGPTTNPPVELSRAAALAVTIDWHNFHLASWRRLHIFYCGGADQRQSMDAAAAAKDSDNGILQDWPNSNECALRTCFRTIDVVSPCRAGHKLMWLGHLELQACVPSCF